MLTQDRTTVSIDRGTRDNLRRLAKDTPISSYLRLVSERGETKDELEVLRASLLKQVELLKDTLNEVMEAIQMIDSKTWKAYLGNSKSIFDLMLSQGKVLSFLDTKYPGLRYAVLTDAKEDSDKMWPEQLRRMNSKEV